MRSMYHFCHLFLFSALLVLSQGLDNDGILQLDGCALKNVVADILNSKETVEKIAKQPLSKKALGKKGSPVKGISQIKVADLKFTEIQVDLIPGLGIQMSVTNKIALSGKSFLGGKIELKLEVNINTTTSLKQDNSSCPKFVKETCLTNLIDVKANLPRGILPNVMNNFLDKSLKTLLPETLCPSVDIILSFVNEKLCTKDIRLPFGKSGNLHFKGSKQPTVTAEHVNVGLNIEVQHGETSIHPSENSSGMVLPDKPKVTSLLMTADFLGCTFTALQQDEIFDLLITESELDDTGAMSLSQLSDILPELPPGLKDYMISIVVDEATMVTLNPSKSLLHLYSTMEVLASYPDSEAVSLFAVQVHMNFNIKFSVDEKSLHAVISLDRTFLTPYSSSVGDFEVLDLNEFITSVIQAAYTPTINDLLQTVIPLPELISKLGIPFSKANIVAVKDLLVISVDVCRA